MESELDSVERSRSSWRGGEEVVHGEEGMVGMVMRKSLWLNSRDDPNC
jgi:hypothetical protein